MGEAKVEITSHIKDWINQKYVGVLDLEPVAVIHLIAQLNSFALTHCIWHYENYLLLLAYKSQSFLVRSLVSLGTDTAGKSNPCPQLKKKGGKREKDKTPNWLPLCRLHSLSS